MTREYKRSNVTNMASAPREAYLLLCRHATEADLVEARMQQLGQIKDVGGARYRIIDLLLDDLARLIGVGQRIEPGEQGR